MVGRMLISFFKVDVPSDVYDIILHCFTTKCKYYYAGTPPRGVELDYYYNNMISIEFLYFYIYILLRWIRRIPIYIERERLRVVVNAF